MKRTRQEKLGTDHAPLPPPEVCEAADRAFESWFKELRLDDKTGATCAKVPKRTLRLVFMEGFQNGGYQHWSTLSEPQVKALVRFYAPEATVRTPKDITASRKILEGLERDVRAAAANDALHALTLARRLGEAQQLLEGHMVPSDEGREPSLPNWSMIEEHGPGWEDHRGPEDKL